MTREDAPRRPVPPLLMVSDEGERESEPAVLGGCMTLKLRVMPSALVKDTPTLRRALLSLPTAVSVMTVVPAAPVSAEATSQFWMAENCIVHALEERTVRVRISPRDFTWKEAEAGGMSRKCAERLPGPSVYASLSCTRTNSHSVRS